MLADGLEMGNGGVTSAGGGTPAPSSPDEGSGMPEPMSETEMNPSSPATSPTPTIDDPHIPDANPINIPDPSSPNIGPGPGSGVPNPDTPDVGPGGPSPVLVLRIRMLQIREMQLLRFQ